MTVTLCTKVRNMYTFRTCTNCVMSAAGAVGYRLKTQLKRYWATDLWQTLFDALLQPSDSLDPPPYDRLLALFQQHLCKNPAIASKLRAELVKQDST